MLKCPECKTRIPVKWILKRKQGDQYKCAGCGALLKETKFETIFSFIYMLLWIVGLNFKPDSWNDWSQGYRILGIILTVLLILFSYLIVIYYIIPSNLIIKKAELKDEDNPEDTGQ